MGQSQKVYDTLTGVLADEHKVPGVEDAFSAGSPCSRRYGEMLDAYERLCSRLGVGEEDVDVEIIINSLLDNQRDLCLQMFSYGRASVTGDIGSQEARK